MEKFYDKKEKEKDFNNNYNYNNNNRDRERGDRDNSYNSNDNDTHRSYDQRYSTLSSQLQCAYREKHTLLVEIQTLKGKLRQYELNKIHEYNPINQNLSKYNYIQNKYSSTQNGIKMCYWIKKHFILKLLGKSFKKWLLISVLLSLNETKKQLIPLNSSSTTYDTTTLIQDTKKDILSEARAILQQSNISNQSYITSQPLQNSPPIEQSSFIVSNQTQITTLLPSSKTLRPSTSFTQPTLSSMNKVKSQETSFESRGRGRERERNNKSKGKNERKRANSLTQLNQGTGTIERKYVNTRLIRSESPTRERNNHPKSQKNEIKQNLSFTKNSLSTRKITPNKQTLSQQKPISRFEESFLLAVSKGKKEIQKEQLKSANDSKKGKKESSNIQKDSSPVILQTRPIHLERDRDIPAYIPVIDIRHSNHSSYHRHGTSTVTTTPSDLTVEDAELMDEYENEILDIRDERENHEVSYLESWYLEKSSQNKLKQSNQQKGLQYKEKDRLQRIDKVNNTKKLKENNTHRLLDEKERSFLLLPHERLQYEKNVRKKLQSTSSTSLTPSGRDDKDEKEGYQEQFLRLKTNNVSIKYDERRRR